MDGKAKTKRFGFAGPRYDFSKTNKMERVKLPFPFSRLEAMVCGLL
jgi:hypothetical protein